MTKKIRMIYMLLLLLLFPFAIAYTDDEAILEAYERLEPVPGPEDMHFDRWNNRIIISGYDRRNPERPGNIYALDPGGQIGILKRVNELAGFTFHPHGISIVESDTGVILLYVIVHGPDTDEGTAHSIAMYEVKPDGLALIERLEDSLLESLNDLAAYPDGRLYVSNDKSRDGVNFEMLLGLRNRRWYSTMEKAHGKGR